jgi:hypothetical protein
MDARFQFENNQNYDFNESEIPIDTNSIFKDSKFNITNQDPSLYSNLQHDDPTITNDKYILIDLLLELEFPLKINDKEEFMQNLLSPGNLRYTTIDWLLTSLDDDNFSIFEKFKEILSDYDRIEIYLIIFKNIGIEYDKSDSDLKKAISGLSCNIEAEKVLLNLVNFVKIHKLLFKAENKENSFKPDKIINESLLIINYLTDNKLTIFKENIRLFAPEIKLKENKQIQNEEGNITFNPKEVQERISSYNKLISKVDKKLDKLKKLNLNFDNVEMENLLELKQSLINFEKTMDGFIKDYNQIYAKDIKYISEDKISNLHLSVESFNEKYNVILNIAGMLEEIFALHNRITNFNV